MAKRSEIQVGQHWTANHDDPDFGNYTAIVTILGWVNPWTVEVAAVQSPHRVATIAITDLYSRIHNPAAVIGRLP